MPTQHDGGLQLEIKLQRPALALWKAVALLLSIVHLVSLNVPHSQLNPNEQLARILVHLAFVALAALCLSPRYGWIGPATMVGYGISPFIAMQDVSGNGDILSAILFFTALGFGMGVFLDWNWHIEHRDARTQQHSKPGIGKIRILHDDSWKRRPGWQLSLLVQWLALIVTIPYFLKGVTDPKYVAYAPVFTLLRAALVWQALACLCLRTGWTGPAMIVGFTVPWLIAPPVDPNSYYVTYEQFSGSLIGFLYGVTLDGTWYFALQTPETVSTASLEGEAENKSPSDDHS